MQETLRTEDLATEIAPPGPDQERLLFRPNARIHGLINDATVLNFLDALAAIRDNADDLYLEINTPGGDADVGRRIALEIKLFLRHSGRHGYVLGKNAVYSAGVTILSAFPRQCRFLCDGTVLLIHERRMDSDIPLKGPIRGCLQIVREQLSMLETAEKLENEGFADLVAGSTLTLDELRRHALGNCYMPAHEALDRRLVAGVLD